MLVDNKNIIKQFSEPGQIDNCPDDPFTMSDVNTMLTYLREQ
jgi:peroxiredoxin